MSGALDVQVSCFPNAFATDGKSNRRPLGDVLDDIHNGVYQAGVDDLRQLLADGKRDDYDSKKKGMPAVTLAGTVIHRANDGLDTPTGLAHYDIDFHPKHPDRLSESEALRDQLAKDKLIVFSLVSPSGAGVKCAIRIPAVQNDEEYKTHWQEGKRYLNTTYRNVTVEKGASDIARLCFMSHDPGLHRNPNALLFPGYRMARLLHTLAEQLWRMVDGERDETRNKVGYTLGGLIAGEQIDEAYALEYFEPIVRATTRHPDKQWRKFQSQLGRGKKRPIKPTPTTARRKHHTGVVDAPDTTPPGAKRKLPNTPLSDVVNAEDLVEQHGQDLRYCHPWGKWLVWSGTHWQEDNTGEVMRRCKATIKDLMRRATYVADEGVFMSMMAHAKNSMSSGKLSAMATVAQSEPGIPVLPEDLDANNWLLNCKNGTLDLKTGDLKPHDRANLLTKVLSVEYNPSAACPTWDAFLWRIMGGNTEPDSPDDSAAVLDAKAADDERAKRLIGFLQKAIGYGLTGDVREQVLFILWGVGANGKSTFLNTIMEILGVYAMKATSELLMVSNNDRHPTERADLFGRRFVSAIETEEGRHLAESFVKEVTGGDPIRARRMREDFWQFNPTHKVFLATNHKPIIKGTDHAIWRRIRLIPFTVVIPDEEQDRTLPEKLRKELPGILRWAVEGCLAWQAEGLGEPAEVKAATQDYRNEMDVVGQFIDDQCYADQGNPAIRVKASNLYEAYQKWCTASGEHALNQRRFGQALTERGFMRRKNNGVWYEGIGLYEQLHNNNGTIVKKGSVDQVVEF